MKRLNVILLTLLAVQVGLATLTWNRSRPTDESSESSRKALEIEPGEIALVSIAGEPGADGTRPELALERSGDDWIIASAGGYPAKGSPAGLLAERLAAVDLVGPVARNASSHASLGVSAEDYARRVVIREENGDETTLFFGNGPRSSSHVRFDGDDQVWSAPRFALSRLGTDARQYVEPLFVSIDRTDLERIQVSSAGGAATLTAVEGGWAVAELPEDADLDAAKIGAIINAASRSIVMRPVGRADAGDYGFERGTTVVVEWGGEDPGALEFAVGDKDEEGNYFAKRADSDFVVTVPPPVGDELVGLAAADLVAAEGAE